VLRTWKLKNTIESLSEQVEGLDEAHLNRILNDNMVIKAFEIVRFFRACLSVSIAGTARSAAHCELPSSLGNTTHTAVSRPGEFITLADFG